MGTMPTALITGASAGLGREFAWQLAESGHGLVLVARGTDRLETLAAQLRAAAHVEVEVMTADLAHPSDVERVAERVRDGERPVDLLVNNAGYGLGGSFLRTSAREEVDALTAMVGAVLVLSRAACDAMVPRGHGAIVNVGSVAGVMTSGTYSAHKAWVRVFTEGLARTLARTGVTATVVNPGLTRTEFHERAGWKASGAPAFAWLSADRVVADTLAAVAAGKAEVTPSLRYRLASLGLRLAPRSLVRRVSRRF